MTFCLGMKVAKGLVGIADTRVTTGTERITARKVSTHQHSPAGRDAGAVPQRRECGLAGG